MSSPVNGLCYRGLHSTFYESVADKVMKEKEKEIPWHWYLWAPIAIFVLSSLHLVVCLFLGLIFWGNEKRCRDMYEYYHPWGWGERKE